MISKLLKKWKEEWWRVNADKIGREYESNRNDLVSRCENEINDIKRSYSIKKELAENELEIAMSREKLSMDRKREEFLINIKLEIDSLTKQQSDIKSLRDSLSNESIKLKSNLIDLQNSYQNELSQIEKSFEEKRSMILERITIETKHLDDKEAFYKNHKAEVEQLSLDLINQNNKLSHEYSNLVSDYDLKKSNLSKKIKLMETELSIKEEEIGILLDRAASKEQEFRKVNEDLNLKIKTLESKASPNTVWLEAFTQGFSKAWDSMNPIMMENVVNAKKAIEEKAIMETIARNSNGHNKKNI